MALTLADLGWKPFFEEAFNKIARPGWMPARLIRETKINFTALIDGGEDLDAVVSGKVWNDALCDADLPSVGDWVALDPGAGTDEPVIRAILPRISCFSRKEPGRSSAQQVLAANVDYVAVVTEPGADFNPRRMERYFTLIAKSGARPIVLLNKADLFPKSVLTQALQELRKLSPDTPMHAVSARDGSGLKSLKTYLKKGITLTIVGSSGVGKSTLVNQLLGDEWLWTGEVNEVTGKGRHTTVARELVVLEKGGMLIDNPGMREIQMWTDEATLRESFADLDELTCLCRYSDCRHGKEPGCALLAAVDSGELNSDRYLHYLRLEEEIAELSRRQKKRQMNLERATKRNRKVKARNYNDRIELEKDDNPNRNRGGI